MKALRLLWAVLSAAGLTFALTFTALAAPAGKPAGKAAPSPGSAAPVSLPPIEGFAAADFPYDEGGAVLLTWKAMPYDGPGVSYAVSIAAEDPAAPWLRAATFPSDTKYKSDIDLPFWAWRKTKDLHAFVARPKDQFPATEDAEKLRISAALYRFKVEAVLPSEGGRVAAESVAAVGRGTGNWVNVPRLNNLLFTGVFCAILLWFISHARRRELFLRRVPGLDAVEEAIGRATEMGRPIYFLTGRKDIDDVSTIAASLVLGEIAKKAASYDTAIKVPHTYALTMAVCQEITKQAYSEAGRPDAYREDFNFFVTEDQFAYTAAVNGMMVREKPAACFYMGYYYAESLLLAEVGSNVGAIQVAGTDSEHQLPFFFVTCDYTLIGEELYAAGAYLSRDPVLTGTLRGQDVGKAFVMLAVFLGVLVSTGGVLFGFEGLTKVMMELFTSY